MSVESNQIIIGSGAEYLYGLIIAMLGRKHVYGIESPSYKKIEQVYRAAEVTYELLSLTHDGIDSTRMWATNSWLFGRKIEAAGGNSAAFREFYIACCRVANSCQLKIKRILMERYQLKSDETVL